MVMDKRPPLDEWLSLFQATVAAEGKTTLAGAAAGNSIIDGGLAGVGANSFVSMLMVVYPGQPRLVDSMDITAFNNGTGEVTFSSAYKGVAAAIPAGVPYKIITFRFVPAEVAAIEAKLDHATHGLAALKALLDIIETKLDAGGLGTGLVTKALTFANQTGQVPLFTVTGDVIVRLVAVVKTNCGSAGGCTVSVGIAANVDAIIPLTDITLLAAQEIWFDATPDSEIEALGTMREHIISDGNDITLNSSAADNSGAITFYCFWTAISTGATVVAV